VPELVNAQGQVTSAQTIDWRGVELAEELAGFGPVCVEADVRAAALAEARFGAGRDLRLFVYVAVGGRLGLAGSLYWDAFVRSVGKHVWAEGSRHLPLLPAALGVDAGLIGAAALAWEYARALRQPVLDLT
jgi:predicted NBD/HSP70 family sugar kinase